MRLVFEVPGVPVSCNAAYRNVSAAMRAAAVAQGQRLPGRVLTAAGRRWKARVAELAWAHALQQAWRYAGGEVGISLRLWWPDGRRRDAHNTEKLTVDAIAAALGFDDRVCHVATAPAGVDRARPRCEVVVWHVGAE